jgi:hypothetical protein
MVFKQNDPCYGTSILMFIGIKNERKNFVVCELAAMKNTFLEYGQFLEKPSRK